MCVCVCVCVCAFVCVREREREREITSLSLSLSLMLICFFNLLITEHIIFLYDASLKQNWILYNPLSGIIQNEMLF